MGPMLGIGSAWAQQPTTRGSAITPFGLYLATPPTITDKSPFPFLLDANGNLKVTGGTPDTSVETPVAPATATATHGLLLGGQYDSTQKTVTGGQQSAYSMSPRGALYVGVGAEAFTVQPGNTANTTPWLVQSSFTPQNITTSTTTTVKSGAGILHGVTVNTKGTIASAVTIYDNTAASGTKIGTVDSLNLSGAFFFDVAFATGLTIVTTGTAPPDITVSYR